MTTKIFEISKHNDTSSLVVNSFEQIFIQLDDVPGHDSHDEGPGGRKVDGAGTSEGEGEGAALSRTNFINKLQVLAYYWFVF